MVAEEGCDSGEFDRAVAALIGALTDAAQAIKSSAFYHDVGHRAAGLEHLVRTLYQAIDRKFWQDPDFPLFRKLDFRAGYGGDSPDQQYLQAFIRGGETYRIWGKLGSQRLIDVRLYAGLPWAGGRVVGHLNSHDLRLEADGGIEIIASPQPAAGNWLENPIGGSEILIREILGDWEKELPGELHIDRVGHEGDLKSVANLAERASRIDAIGEWLRFGVRTFQELVGREILSLPANTLGPPKTMAQWQGMAQRVRAYAFGHFDLSPDQALLVSVPKIDAEYMGVTINNLWYFTPEYANRQPSLSDRQASVTRDGIYHFVVCERDPGVANWLDTVGLGRGLVMLRYDGVSADGIAPSDRPTARRIPFSDVHLELPADAPCVTPAQRADAIRARRRGIQLRNVQ
jgi:hypothetical protein